MDLEQAIKRITEVAMFENWLRFYFISPSDDGKFFIKVSKDSEDRVHKNSPQVFGLIKYLNNKEINHQYSLECVCKFIQNDLSGEVISLETMEKVFNNVDFNIELALFSNWLQHHDEQLSSAFIDFSVWQAMFAEWKDDEDVDLFREKLQKKYESKMV